MARRVVVVVALLTLVPTVAWRATIQHSAAPRINHHSAAPRINPRMSDKPPPPSSASAACRTKAQPLGGLLADAFKRIQSDPDKPIKMKSFVFSTTTKNIRVVPGDDLPRYMLLPIEEYALYDDKLMSRIGDDIFELRLPVTNPSGAPSALALDPTLRVRVTQAPTIRRCASNRLARRSLVSMRTMPASRRRPRRRHHPLLPLPRRTAPTRRACSAGWSMGCARPI